MEGSRSLGAEEPTHARTRTGESQTVARTAEAHARFRLRPRTLHICVVRRSTSLPRPVIRPHSDGTLGSHSLALPDPLSSRKDANAWYRACRPRSRPSLLSPLPLPISLKKKNTQEKPLTSQPHPHKTPPPSAHPKTKGRHTTFRGVRGWTRAGQSALG
jgi:hypothetical protein